jgi:transcriptional regulator with XRE-family HTH domain
MKVDSQLLYQHVGILLKEQRATLGMSQAELGVSVGLGRTSISNIELGVQKAPLHVLYDLCIQLGIEPRDIIPTIEQATTKPEILEYPMGGKVRRLDPRNIKLVRKYEE